MSSHKVRNWIYALLLLLGTASAAVADVRELLGRIPGDANALVIIDVDKMVNSPMGKQEGWKEKLADAYANKPMVVLPGTKRVAMGALLELGTGEPIWEVSVMEIDSVPAIKDIAKAEKGYVDKLGDMPAAWSPIDAYFVQLGSNMFGAVCPANRQFAARWARQKQTLGGEFVSSYLKHAATAADKGTEVLMALDLEDVTSVAKVSRRLRQESFDSLQGKEIDAPAFAKALASIKGLELLIDVGEEATGRGVIDFAEDTKALGDLAKPLLLEMLAKYGMALPEFEDWKVTAASNQITASGKLTAEGLRCLLSVVDPPTPAQLVAATSTPEPPAPKEPAQPSEKKAKEKPAPEKSASGKASAAKISQKYYQTVAKILDNLEKNIGKGTKSASLADSAGWLQRDARRIDRLPILNVDPDLVAWGSEVSTRLREISRVFDIGVMQTRAGINAVQSGNRGTYVGSVDDGGEQGAQADLDRQTRDAQSRQSAQEQKANAYKAAEQIIQGLRGSRTKMRAMMTERYGIDF